MTPPTPSSPPPAEFDVLMFTLGPHQTNCYLAASAGRCWIVDAGFGAGAMSSAAKERGWLVEALVLTHAHVDHIGGVRDVIQNLDPRPPILLHTAESTWLASPQLNLSAAMGMPVTAPGPDAPLEHGQELTLGDMTWTVLHTPGHSPGSVTLYCASEGLAFVGDALFRGSTGRWDFPTSNEEDLRRSVIDVLFELPDDTRVLCGHGEPTTIGDEKAHNPVVRDMWGWTG